MNIVIPMSGIGKRFLDAGYSDPKPLIPVDGKPIIEHVVNLFPGETNFVFVCNREHIEKTNMRDILKRVAPKGQIVIIEPHKLGPVHAVLQAEQLIVDDEPTIVNYCDFAVGWDYADFKRRVLETHCDAAVAAYKGFHPHLLSPGLYASMTADEDNWMLECREKYSFTENKMDSYQQAGSFYFHSGKILKDCFHEVKDCDLRVNNEYYVSVATQVLAENGKRVHVYPLQFFCQWGTPEDLKKYQRWSELVQKVLRNEINESSLEFNDEDERKVFDYWKAYHRQYGGYADHGRTVRTVIHDARSDTA